MTDSYIDIPTKIGFTTTATITGTSYDVYVALAYYPMDSIGDRKVIVSFEYPTFSSGSLNNTLEYGFSSVGTLLSGITNNPVEYFTTSTLTSGSLEYLTQFYYGTLQSGNINNIVSFNHGYVSSGTQDFYVNITFGELYSYYTNTSIGFYVNNLSSGVLPYEVEYINFSGNYTISGTPIPSYDIYRDIVTYYRLNSLNISGANNNIVDFKVAGWVNYPLISDVYSCSLAPLISFPFVSTCISGGVDCFNTEVYCATSGVVALPYNVYSCLVDLASFNFDSNVISGSIDTIDFDLYSCGQQVDSFTCDIDLFPIKIYNFSLDVGEYTSSSNYISVDVVDDVYSISTSGTYFVLNGNRVDVTLSGITDGYRMYYDPNDDFTTLSGLYILTAHGENSNGDYLEVDYVLGYGYSVDYFNNNDIKEYGFNNEIVVRMEAEDYGLCPNKSVDAFMFKTAPIGSSDLMASINCVPLSSGAKDLQASIYPLSTAFYYDKEITVVITAKDFAGNEMSPYQFTFRITNPNQ